MQKNSNYQLLSIILLFSMLWLPLGQYDFLMENWMKIGTFAIPFILLGMFTYRSSEKPILNDYRALATLMLIFYLVHQYEEHWTDLLGRHYSFFTVTNEMIKSIAGNATAKEMPLTRESIFIINTSLVWLVGVNSIWRIPRHLFPSLAMAAIILVNAITHILGGIIKFSYNPGLLTSIIIFVPFSVYYYREVLKADPAAGKQITASIIWGILAHILMVGGMVLANVMGVIPEMAYFAVLIIWSVLPLFLFREHGLPVQAL